MEQQSHTRPRIVTLDLSEAAVVWSFMRGRTRHHVKGTRGCMQPKGAALCGDRFSPDYIHSLHKTPSAEKGRHESVEDDLRL